MMEIMQIGAQPVSPCDFQSALSVAVLNRMGEESGLKAQARDLATAKSELIDIHPIDVYRLRIGEVSFRHKVTGEIRQERTVLSDDFMGEPLGVWTDAGEHGTGTKEEYSALIERAHRFAETEGDASMFWISRGSQNDKEDIGRIPPHRAYVWKKDQDGNIEATSYQLIGSQDSLTRLIDTLGMQEGRREDVVLPDTIIRRAKIPFSHQEVFDAYKQSLTDEERQEAKAYLDVFGREVDIPNHVQEERVRRSEQEYEKQLRAAYTGDIQAALGKVAFSIPAIAHLRDREPNPQSFQKVTISFSHQREDSTREEQRDGRRASIHSFVSDEEETKKTMQAYERKRERKKENRTKRVSVGDVLSTIMKRTRKNVPVNHEEKNESTPFSFQRSEPVIIEEKKENRENFILQYVDQSARKKILLAVVQRLLYQDAEMTDNGDGKLDQDSGILTERIDVGEKDTNVLSIIEGKTPSGILVQASLPELLLLAITTRGSDADMSGRSRSDNHEIDTFEYPSSLRASFVKQDGMKEEGTKKNMDIRSLFNSQSVRSVDQEQEKQKSIVELPQLTPEMMQLTTDQHHKKKDSNPTSEDIAFLLEYVHQPMLTSETRVRIFTFLTEALSQKFKDDSSSVLDRKRMKRLLIDDLLPFSPTKQEVKTQGKKMEYLKGQENIPKTVLFLTKLMEKIHPEHFTKEMYAYTETLVLRFLLIEAEEKGYSTNPSLIWSYVEKAKQENVEMLIASLLELLDYEEEEKILIISLLRIDEKKLRELLREMSKPMYLTGSLGVEGRVKEQVHRHVFVRKQKRKSQKKRYVLYQRTHLSDLSAFGLVYQYSPLVLGRVNMPQ